MDSALAVHRLHFAFTITFHYLFPQLTMGLALLILILKTMHLWTRDEHYGHCARFWAKMSAIDVRTKQLGRALEGRDHRLGEVPGEDRHRRGPVEGVVAGEGPVHERAERVRADLDACSAKVSVLHEDSPDVSVTCADASVDVCWQ